MPIDILMIAPMSSVERGLKNYTVHHLPPAEARPAFLQSVAGRIRGIVTFSGGGVVDQALLNALPKVEIIANMGVGFDSVDMAAARARDIIVTNAGASNAVDVAEHAIGLMLDVGRKISFGDRYVRAGDWALKGRIKITHRVSGKKLGIVGLGNIGIEIAKRAAAFDMPISYHNRKARGDVPYRYVDNVVKLARESDILICATPGGDGTRHLISGAVIGALGPDGILVNIGRGTTVDEAALVTALTSGALGGAGLDVFEDEPRVPDALLTLPHVVLQPHVGGATYEGIAAAVDMLVQNLDLHFAGKPVLTPV
ncbi:MAG: 2-hydroxyacid dehydrogenase [Rhodospirillaceae bacterium]|nr:2-hydroxyacid dehydrogenase [Rhodospirillaceae bacterium]